jgi:putative toxin-antitoxin system antitoxin component (TIGR02293 family)
MLIAKTKASRFARTAPKGRAGADALGLAAGDVLRLVGQVRAGFPFSRLARFQKASGLPWEKIARFASIPQRTLTRRQNEGRLNPEESDRVWRASAVFGKAVDLFEGDVAAARRWLQTPQPALGGQVPLEIASTEVGAREVENLIGRLEHGVVA